MVKNLNIQYIKNIQLNIKLILIIDSEMGHETIVNYLVKYSTNINKEVNYGKASLFYASEKEKMVMVKQH